MHIVVESPIRMKEKREEIKGEKREGERVNYCLNNRVIVLYTYRAF